MFIIFILVCETLTCQPIALYPGDLGAYVLLWFNIDLSYTQVTLVQFFSPQPAIF